MNNNFGWYHRSDKRGPDHVISLCAGHKYLTELGGWQVGTGDMPDLPPADRCCVCMGTADISEIGAKPIPDGKREGRRQCAVAFGRQVREARKAAGLRQDAAARLLDMSTTQVGLVELGKAYPKKPERIGILALLRAVPGAGGTEVCPAAGKPAESPPAESRG
jgi:DNA-binding XRE family transcriptional regulator